MLRVTVGLGLNSVSFAVRSRSVPTMIGIIPMTRDSTCSESSARRSFQTQGVVILASRPHSKARSPDGVGGVDCSMDGKTGRAADATLTDIARSSLGILFGLAGLRANLKQRTQAWCASGLGMDRLAELADGESVDHTSVAADVAPQSLVAAQTCLCLAGADLEDLDCVAGCRGCVVAPAFDRG